IVCDYDEALISRLERRRLVVRVDDPSRLNDAARFAQERNALHALWLRVDEPLSGLPFTMLEALHAVPLYLDVTAVGNFRTWRDQVDRLRRLNVLVMVPEDAPVSYRDLRILSSLLIPCGIRFGSPCPDWEALTDLLYYAAYGKVLHAPIQPFHFVLSGYERHQRTDFSGITFDDPSRYLHIDSRGCIALTRKELEQGAFIESDLEKLDAVGDLPAYQSRLESWRDFFLKQDGCAYCPGWRICLGAFAGTPGNRPGCQKFFAEFLEAAEYHLDLRTEATRTILRPWDACPA
ncbi:MAG TPA: hypothetical protein DCS05_08940, partial [Nitrospiraceae bacterium]|nr:hypothetical protein [Nitrospiraceae bacterium]